MPLRRQQTLSKTVNTASPAMKNQYPCAVDPLLVSSETRVKLMGAMTAPSA